MPSSAVPALTSHVPDTCTKYASAEGGNNSNDGSVNAPYKTVGVLLSNLPLAALAVSFGYAAGSRPSSTCSVQTTADAIVPGTIAEGRRANIELGQIEVFDTGEDGRPSTGGPSYSFPRQGIFIP